MYIKVFSKIYNIFSIVFHLSVKNKIILQTNIHATAFSACDANNHKNVFSSLIFIFTFPFHKQMIRIIINFYFYNIKLLL